MATSFAATTSPACVAKNVNKPTSQLRLCHCHCHSHHHSYSKLSFRLPPKPRLSFFSKGLQSSWNRTPVIRERLNEVRFLPRFSLEDVLSKICSFKDKLLEPSVAVKVSVDGPPNAAATSVSESDVLPVEAKNSKSSNEPSSADLTSKESISEFISQVANLVKLVDSRDIVELQLKQCDCELLIRKEALPQQQPSAPTPSAPAHSQAPSPEPFPSASKPSKSALPPLKCPMAGTFYRAPAPNEPPFVKVGDKVQKGQVLCMIEAMKLMNEIEADESGTIVEILAEDGKPVSVYAPLFVIEP